MTSPPGNLHSRSAIETLPYEILEAILHKLARTDRSDLLRLAQASPMLYAPAITVAIHVARDKWAMFFDCSTAGPPCSSMKYATTFDQVTPGSLGFDAITKSVHLIVAANKGLGPKQVTLVGPIAPRHLRFVFLTNETASFLAAASFPFPLAHDVHWRIGQPALARIALSDLERFGGFPRSVTKLEVYINSEVALVVPQFSERFVALIAASHIKSLDFSLHGNAQVNHVMIALLVSGLPQRLVSLSLSGLRDIKEPLVDGELAVLWPTSLKHLAVNLGSGDKLGNAYLCHFLATIPGNLPALQSLELKWVDLKQNDVCSQLAAALVSTLTSFRLLELDEVVRLQHLHPVVRALSTKCPGLQKLYFSYFDDYGPRPGLMAFTKTTAPLLRCLPLLNELGLNNFGFHSTTNKYDPLFTELAAAAPNLQRLDLSRNSMLGLKLARLAVQSFLDLKCLDLRWSGIKEIDCTKLRAMKPSLEVISIHF